MTTSLDAAAMDTINDYDGDKRYQYLLKTVISHGQIWILTDDDGAVMLNTEDEDGVPVWPNKEFAQAWATGEWSDCQPKCISLEKWHRDWTGGLLDDDLAVIIFPNFDDEGLVIFADEFDYELKQKAKKNR